MFCIGYGIHTREPWLRHIYSITYNKYSPGVAFSCVADIAHVYTTRQHVNLPIVIKMAN